MTKKTDKQRLVVLDAHAILHRAYHALPDFTSPAGEPTGALYGLVTMLLKIIADLKPDYIVAAYDLPAPTHRHEVYEGYKGKRAKTDDELVAQINRSRDIFSAFGITVYEASGFEADDVIGTIVEKTKSDTALEVVIASGDMDTLQLVDDDRVRVYTLKKGIKDTVLYDTKAVIERYGFAPELLTDYKGLSGDQSDNIIGVPGIGEKTATELLQNIGTIEEIYALLEKKGATAFTEKGIKPRTVKLLEEHEEEAHFSKLLATIRRDAPIDFSIPEKRWSDGLELEKVLTLFNELGFRSLSARVSALFGEKSTNEQEATNTEQKPPEEKINEKELKETAVALWLLHSDTLNPTREDILQYGKTASLNEARKVIFADLKRHHLDTVFETIEKPLIPILAKMHERGIKLDQAYLKKRLDEYRSELHLLEKKVWKEAGGEFNINSPRQLGDVLFDRLKFGTGKGKRTATGQRSTREDELQKLAGEHPIIDAILEYRELQKLISTYLDPLTTLLDTDGRLHATFLQAGSATGRMASQNPNVQNIPIKTEKGRAIRRAFIAEKGFTLATLDYSQIELRIAAFLSGDKKMIETFERGEDVHTRVASEVFDVPFDKVTHEMRRKAKVINFGILYGMGSNALAKTAEISRQDAQVFLAEYLKDFPGLARYIETTKQEVREKGYTETLFGRRRYLPGITSKHPGIKAEAERQAINAPMQGTQADIIKIAMARVDAYLKNNTLEHDVYLLLQIHDELIYEIRDTKVKEIVPEIKKIMEGIVSPEKTKDIPIVVDAHIGKNWADIEPL